MGFGDRTADKRPTGDPQGTVQGVAVLPPEAPSSNPFLVSLTTQKLAPSDWCAWRLGETADAAAAIHRSNQGFLTEEDPLTFPWGDGWLWLGGGRFLCDTSVSPEVCSSPRQMDLRRLEALRFPITCSREDRWMG
ncbi:hypothetical protein O3P69_005096 [Scylla paramamosain]|uniref:Uncharacterized protein n=1 Tax=Scylla paramamosain TaxID=85552 RepID=A0AAW0UBM2_SCYPA